MPLQDIALSTWQAHAYVPARTVRMAAFGCLLYGPFQHWWYAKLAATISGKALSVFSLKVRGCWSTAVMY